MLKTKTNRIWPLVTSALFGFLFALTRKRTENDFTDILGQGV